MQIDPYCQRRKCSPVNVVSSDIRVQQIFAGVREIWGVKQESGCTSHMGTMRHVRSRKNRSLGYKPMTSAASNQRQHVGCRAITLALARLSCCPHLPYSLSLPPQSISRPIQISVTLCYVIRPTYVGGYSRGVGTVIGSVCWSVCLSVL